MINFSFFGKAIAAVTLTTLPLLSQAGSINVDGNDIFELDNYTDILRTYDNSQVTIAETGTVGWSASTYDNSTLTVNGGSLTTLWAKNDSQVTINGGSVSYISTQHQSDVTLSNVSDLRYVYIWGESSLNIQAQDVETIANNISGVWADGSAFSFNVFNFTGSSALIPNNVVVNEVPVPATAWLFSSAVMGLAIIGRRRRLGAESV